MKKTKVILLWFIIVVFLGVLFWYTFENNSLNIREKEAPQIYLGSTEEAFVKNNHKVGLTIGEDLDYMIENDFLRNYLEEAVPLMKFEVSQKNQEARGKVVIVDGSNREELSKRLLTKPLFIVKGTLFKKVRLTEKDTYTAVGIKGSMTGPEIKKIKYNGRAVKYIQVNSKEELGEFLKVEKPDLIIGDVNVISNIVKGNGQYINTGKEVFKRNVSIVLDKGEDSFYKILTLHLESLNRESAIITANEKSNTDLLVYSGEKRYSESIVLIVIVFLTVFGAFLIYYLSTKNLYHELTTRMDQLVESKSEMKTTFNGVPFYMAELDVKGHIVNLNKAMAEALKLPFGEVKGKHILDVFSMGQDVTESLLTAIEEASKKRKGQNNIATFDSKIFDIDVYPIETQKASIEKLLFMAADVTNMKMAERQMLQQNKMIAVGQLAAGVAHEIRNPLGIIRNYSYVLKTTALDDDDYKKKAIAGIERALDSSEKIIRNLLNFSRVSKEEAERLNIKEHIESLISINEGMLKKKQISINVKSEKIFFAELIITSFDMIFINLLTNSVDAIKDNGKININLWQEEEDFFMEFSDNGSGMNREVLSNMFNPFFTTKGSAEGNGLGMYIVYNEVEKLNGKIEVESIVNVGTTFKIKFPLMEREA